MDQLMQLFNDIAAFWKPPAVEKVWQWAEKNIILSARITPYPGRYRSDWCPYVREPQEVFTDPSIHDIILCWASRSSKTETALNCIRYSIACDPQAIMIVMPTDVLGRSFSETRLMPSIDDCPALSAEKPVNLDQYKLMEMHFKRCSLWVVGSNSPATLKGRGVTILFCDEIDTWPQATSKETGALQQVLERTKDRWNRKHIITSTPTVENGQIWQEFLAGDQRYYFVPCPHCQGMQNLKLKQIIWDEESKKTDGTWDVIRVKQSAKYKCEHCGNFIFDHHKPAMLAKGEWRPTAANPHPGRRSYHLNSLYPVWISFGEVADMFLRSKASPEELQRFVNSWMAEPFYEFGDVEEQERTLLKKMASSQPAGCPAGSRTIATIDVQQNNIYIIIRAWQKNGDSILCEFASLPWFEEALQLCQRWNVSVVLVDAAYRQNMVLEWCASHPGWYPISGAAGLSEPFRWATISVDFGLLKGRNIRMIRFQPNYFREEIFGRLNGKGPKWEIHPNVSQQYRQQMLAEKRVERRDSRGRTIIEWVQIRRDNHAFDCEVNNLMGFELFKPYIYDLPVECHQAVSLPPDPVSDYHRKLLDSMNEDIWNGRDFLNL